MKYTNIAILGLGAVGSYVLWGLTNRTDINLCVVADGQRRDRLTMQGITINGREYHPAVKTPSEARGADLLIVCTKYTSLLDSLDDIATIACGQKTDVMSLLNGVDSEEIIGDKIGAEHVIPALIKVASERKNNNVKFDPETTIGIVYGEADGKISDRILGLDELFADTGIHYRHTDVILSEIWSKFRLNVSNNQPQAMVGCGVGAYTDSEHVAFIRDKLRDELEAIAKAKGIDMSLADSSSFRGSKVMPRARYSTLQDLDAKRHTEVDVFAGAISKMGRELGIPTPYNDFTYHMIKALEEKNDGLFDYE